MKKLVVLSLSMLFLAEAHSADADPSVGRSGNILFNLARFPDLNLDLSKKEVVIGTDFNDVLFYKDMGLQLQLFNAIWSEKGLLYALYALREGYKVKSLKKQLRRPAEDIFHMLAQQNNDPDLERILTNATLTIVKFDDDVAKTLKDASSGTVKVLGISNMGTGMAQLQADRLKEQADKPLEQSTPLTPEEVDLYNWAYKLISDKQTVIATPDGQFYKPNPDAFEEFQKRNNHHKNKVTMIIEDKEANARAALQNGFDCACLVKNKYANQEIRDCLAQLGLLSKPQ